MIADDVIKILNNKNMYAKKQFGQNFLIDKNILNKIVEISNVSKEDIVIEIGPGMGCLTEYLCIQAKKVICYEIDKDMVQILNDNIKTKYENVDIINLDFLQADLSFYNDEENCSNVKVIANLPYYITTPIIFKLLTETKIKWYTFMVQKEVGERLTGKPNTKDYNALSVAMNVKTKSKIAYKVKPNCFYPAPKVDSVLLTVETIKNDCGAKKEGEFLKFVQDIFAQRRKTIINNLTGKYGYNKEDLIMMFEKYGIKKEVRAEALNSAQIYDLFEKLIVANQEN